MDRFRVWRRAKEGDTKEVLEDEEDIGDVIGRSLLRIVSDLVVKCYASPSSILLHVVVVRSLLGLSKSQTSDLVKSFISLFECII